VSTRRLTTLGAVLAVLPMLLASGVVFGAYQNLKVLPSDIAEPDLQATMRRISVDLGVECSHCHAPGNFASDDLAAKKTARDMMEMTIAINRDHFPDATQPVVSCVTCHRGSLKPVTLPRRGPRRVPEPAQVPAGPPDPRTLPLPADPGSDEVVPGEVVPGEVVPSEPPTVPEEPAPVGPTKPER
jgi:hypothetical protein